MQRFPAQGAEYQTRNKSKLFERNVFPSAQIERETKAKYINEQHTAVR